MRSRVGVANAVIGLPRFAAGAAALLLLAAGWFPGGCRTLGPINPAPDRTDGLVIELLDRRDTNSLSRFKVERDGTLKFGGGFDALNEVYSWSGPLSDEEIARLHELNRTWRWLDVEPVATDRVSSRTYDLSIQTPSRRRRYRVKGECDAIVPLRELLEHAANRRLEIDLKQLPKPGLQREY